MMTSKLALLTTLLLAPLTELTAADTPKPSKPNILFVLADDLGWTDLACQGSTFYETPNIDSLARRGVRFTNGYATCCVCSPSRASLMTGKYPPRTGITDLIPGSPNGKLIRAPNAQHLALEEVTVAEAFRAAGYETFFAGKWHLGDRGYSPDKQGFPASLTQVMEDKKSSNFWFPKSDKPIVATEDDPKFSDRIADEAARFINANAQRPFFAYLPFLAPHRPVKARADLVAKYEKNALVAPSDAWGKERGNDVRVPWIIVAPGVTQAGSTNETPITSTDLYPTLLELANQPLKPEQHLDGVSLVPVLKGGTISSRSLFWHYPRYGAQHGAPFGAVRDVDWKLIEWYEDDRLELFRLSDDPGEKKNLAKTETAKANELRAALHEWRTRVNGIMPTPKQP